MHDSPTIGFVMSGFVWANLTLIVSWDPGPAVLIVPAWRLSYAISSWALPKSIPIQEFSLRSQYCRIAVSTRWKQYRWLAQVQHFTFAHYFVAPDWQSLWTVTLKRCRVWAPADWTINILFFVWLNVYRLDQDYSNGWWLSIESKRFSRVSEEAEAAKRSAEEII